MSIARHLDPDVIFSDGALQIGVVPGFADAYVRLLAETSWGSDGLRYISHGIDHELGKIPDFRTAELRVDGALIGGYGLGFKRVVAAGRQVEAVHRMFLSVHPAAGARGYGRLLMQQVRRAFLDEATRPTICYGYIEADNSRSLNTAEKVGYQRIATLRAELFSRLSPVDSARVEPLGDRRGFADTLRDRYRSHALVDLDQSFEPASYWILSEGDRILAGAQIEPRRWTVTSLGGGVLDLVLQTLPYLPVAKRYLRGGDFRFLAVSNVFAADDAGDAALELIEAMLARRGLHAAMWIADIACPVAEQVRAAGSFGALQRLARGSEIYVMAGSANVEDDAQAELRSRPVLVSPLDPT